MATPRIPTPRIPTPRIAAAIVLVGGLSTRMGHDKASLVVDGASMLARVTAAVSEAGIDKVVIVGPGYVSDAAPPNLAGDPRIEPGERQGPLAGIVGGWRELCTLEPSYGDELVAVLACDLPGLSADVLHELGSAAATHTHGAVAHDGERPQPLLAVYPGQSLVLLEQAFAAGERSVRRCSTGWDVGIVSFDAHLVADADTPADLEGFNVEWPR